MSSGFVSGGTNDAPVERDDEWLKAQQEIEANRRRKEELSRQSEGKSLYEVLQENKGKHMHLRHIFLRYLAKKQEAFEESIKLKNQFRALDEDEIEFLDSVMESTRNKEAEIKKETLEQLDVFRKRQELLERGAATEEKAGSPEDEEESWATSGRKRKKGREKEGFKGVKLRKTSSAAEDASKQVDSTSQPQQQIRRDDRIEPASTKNTPAMEKGKDAVRPEVATERKDPAKVVSPVPTKPSAAAPTGLGLGGYSSGED